MKEIFKDKKFIFFSILGIVLFFIIIFQIYNSNKPIDIDDRFYWVINDLGEYYG